MEDLVYYLILIVVFAFLNILINGTIVMVVYKTFWKIKGIIEKRRRDK